MAGYCEHGDETLDTIQAGNFLRSCATVSYSRRSRFCGVSGDVLMELEQSWYPLILFAVRQRCAAVLIAVCCQVKRRADFVQERNL